MDDMISVCEVNRIANLAKQLESLRNRQLSFIAIAIKWQTLNVLHNKVWQAVLGGSTIKQASDIRVVKPRKNLPFVSKTTKDDIRVHPALDQFYSHALPESSVIAPRQIDRAHTSTANFPHDLIGSQSSSNRRIHKSAKRRGTWKEVCVKLKVSGYPFAFVN